MKITLNSTFKVLSKEDTERQHLYGQIDEEEQHRYGERPTSSSSLERQVVRGERAEPRASVSYQ